MNIPSLSRPVSRRGHSPARVWSTGIVPQSTPSCVWRGKAPFCSPTCNANETQVWSDKSGDGDACVTGHKILCCRCV
jgi:hypothetical protein